MALIKCPECGQEISDKAVACPNCGCPISGEASPVSSAPVTTDGNSLDKVPANPARKRKRVTLILIFAIMIVLIVAGFILGRFFLFPEMQYQKATKLYNEGDMAQAYDAFSEIQDYKNSQVMMGYCIYNQGIVKCNAREYVEAIELFQKCITTKDASELIDRCNYFLAEQSFSEGDYDSAIRLLENNDYPDCKTLLDKCNYQLAVSAFAEGNYDSAIELLTNNTYLESEALLEKSKTEKEMNEKSDYAFLADLEQSVFRRMERVSKERYDNLDLVTTELACVEKYYYASFYDVRLKQLAQKYIDGLRQQKEALSEFYEWDRQEKWNTGLVARYEVLNELYQKYGFLKDNNDFIGTYVSQLEYQKKWLNAFNELEDMFGKQYAGDFWKANNKYIYFTFTNTTKYTFTNQLDVWIYNLDGDKLLDTRSYVTKDIRPGDTFTIEIYVGEFDGCQIKDFGNWYPDIQIP